MTTREDKPTAMRREYQKVRAAHPGRVIFWQKGDFFETYEDDAKLAASVLDLQLTTGSFGALKVPMAGVPVGKVAPYLQRLVDRGYQVVLVEEREGAIEAHQRADRARLHPHERLAQIVPGRPTGDWVQGQVTPWPAWRWDHRTTVEVLQQHFQTASLAGFGLQDRPLATRAAGAILQYLQETQRGACAHIERVHWYNPAAFMFLDPSTRRNLELLTSTGAARQGTLIDVLDQTVTPMGARLLRIWVTEPLTDLSAIAARQEVVARFVAESVLRAEIRAGLKPVGDLERTAAQVLQGTATPRDLSRLRDGLQAVPPLAQCLATAGLLQRGAGAPPELV